MEIKVNKENCIGCGLCVNICPEVFAIDENGKSEVLEGNIEKFKNAIDDSIKSCPVNAIRRSEMDKEKLVQIIKKDPSFLVRCMQKNSTEELTNYLRNHGVEIEVSEAKKIFITLKYFQSPENQKKLSGEDLEISGGVNDTELKNCISDALNF